MTVADITTRVRGLDAEVPLIQDDGMTRPCVVNLDHMATVPRRLLRSRITTLSPSRMTQVSRALQRALGLPRPCAIG